MSQHSSDQRSITLFIWAILLVIFGFTSLFSPYWAVLMLFAIPISAVIGWGLAALFQALLAGPFEIRSNILNQTTLNHKYTKWWFGASFNMIQFIVITFSTILIDNLLNDFITGLASKYGSGWSLGLGITSLLVALALLVGIGVFSD